jgi:Protein of unknown function (DUF1375)
MPYRQVYGGVLFDARHGLDLFTDSSCGHAGLPGCVLQKGIVAPYFWLVDLPVSAVFDTLTLPLTIGTPTGCPVDLAWKEGAGWYCSFEGSWNSNCGDSKLGVVVKVSDENLLTLTFYEEGRAAASQSGQEFPAGTICIFATVDSARTARLIGWHAGESFCADGKAEPLSGAVTLSDDGERLAVAPDEAPFRLNGCAFTTFSGTFNAFQPPE